MAPEKNMSSVVPLSVPFGGRLWNVCRLSMRGSWEGAEEASRITGYSQDGVVSQAATFLPTFCAYADHRTFNP